MKHASILALFASLAVGLALAFAPQLACGRSPEPGSPRSASSPRTKVYVFPMVGQMGTDISEPIFKTLIEDVKKQKPDILVLRLKSADVDRINHLRNDDPNEFGLVNEITTYRDMVKSVHDELRDIPQVMWLEDAVGVSGLAALAWQRMYMTSDARLGGLNQFEDMVEAQWQDAEVRSKMVAEWSGIMKGLVQLGGHPDTLADAMIFAERTLSVTVDSTDVTWVGDTTGTWVVDSSEERAVRFEAPVAEEILLSDGTADTLDDLVFLLGYRDYTKIETGEKIAKQYTDDWRKGMKNVLEWMEEASQTEDDIAGLGRRKSFYEKVLAALKSFPVIEKRREIAGNGISRQAIEGAIDDITRDVRRQRDAATDGS